MKKENNHLTFKDFTTDQEVRWCPGCGDYAILRAMQHALVKINLAKHKHICISGIGCSSRLPYYLNIFGLHTIHGRAPAVAMGVYLSQPNTKPWIITGDGDALSIGIGHFHHFIRRNINSQILLFNNEIYGLTKGQYSPSSRINTISPTSPHGSSEQSTHIGKISLASGVSFFARSTDVDKSLQDYIVASYHHKGCALIEILQNCIVYNKDIFNKHIDKKTKDQYTIYVKNGEPLIYDNGKKGLFFEQINYSIYCDVINDKNINKVITHNTNNLNLANLLVEMDGTTLPLALGILYDKTRELFEHSSEKNNSEKDIHYFLNNLKTWKK